jgi:AcrR family transcriptional regulator
MSVADINPGTTTISAMGRWASGTQGRLQEAALVLFVESGFQSVTVAEIAAAANVSERTFFRYFATKEDVLFVHGEQILNEIVTAIRDAPDNTSPADLVGAAIVRLTELFQPDRAKHKQRIAIIQTDQALRERDLLKQSLWVAAIVHELEQRNVGAVRAAALAGAATAGFRAAFHQWISDRSKTTLQQRVQSVLEQLASDLQ